VGVKDELASGDGFGKKPGRELHRRFSQVGRKAPKGGLEPFLVYRARFEHDDEPVGSFQLFLALGVLTDDAHFAHGGER
jgi:hypothetical protein